MPQSNLVNGQVITVGVTDRRLIAAMRAVPRHAFLPPSMQAIATVESHLRLREDSSGSPPRYLMRAGLFARLIEAARVGPDDNVLDIGCATGYSTAVLARLGACVTGLDVDSQLAMSARETLLALGVNNVEIVLGPFELGWPEREPYDVIVVGGSVHAIPTALASQLKDGGRLVTILGDGPSASAHLFVKSGSVLSGRKLFHATARPLPGFTSPTTFVF